MVRDRSMLTVSITNSRQHKPMKWSESRHFSNPNLGKKTKIGVTSETACALLVHLAKSTTLLCTEKESFHVAFT